MYGKEKMMKTIIKLLGIWMLKIMWTFMVLVGLGIFMLYVLM